MGVLSTQALFTPEEEEVDYTRRSQDVGEEGSNAWEEEVCSTFHSPIVHDIVHSLYTFIRHQVMIRVHIIVHAEFFVCRCRVEAVCLKIDVSSWPTLWWANVKCDCVTVSWVWTAYVCVYSDQCVHETCMESLQDGRAVCRRAPFAQSAGIWFASKYNGKKLYLLANTVGGICIC